VPFYEYQAEDPKKSCKHCKDRFDELQSIHAEPLKCCPKCNNPVKKLVSLPAGHIVKGREPNQYNDVIGAKYWRDKNGNRHRVTEADGLPSSPTVSSRKYRSDEEVKAIKKRAAKDRTKRLSRLSYQNYVKRMKQHRG
jgi:putative FmdB family regulatory protein